MLSFRSLVRGCFVALSSCNVPATQVVVELDADASARGGARLLAIDVLNDDGDTQSITVDFPGASWPVRVPLVPRDGDSSRTFVLEARLTDGTGARLGTQRVYSGYVENELRTIRRVFSADCAAVECGAGLACDAGVCASACYAAERVPAACPSACDGPDACPGRRCTAGMCDFYASCAELRAGGSMVSGVYPIDPDGLGGGAPFSAYCEMEADGGGFTLVMKIDGAATTFAYESPLWTNAETLRPDAPDLDRTEAKLAGFSTLPVREVRIGLAYGGDTRWLVLPVAGSSLLAIFEAGTYRATSAGRSAWMDLLDGGFLPADCDREGFNVVGTCCERVRIGHLGDVDSPCDHPDAWLGIGGTGGASMACGFVVDEVTAGNFSACAMQRNESAFAYVFVR